ncbi:transposase [Streptomyces sp. ECR3.8]|uniref:transposase n=1 Tax=Streptomyces sp. ECR3.8 TaxID=3461009 RepID=UPI004041E33B
MPAPPARSRSQEKRAPDQAEPEGHALGRSRGGLSTKVHLASDSHARPLALRVTAGQAGDAPAFETVMADIRVPRSGPGRPRTRPDVVLADRAHSSRAIREHLRQRGIRARDPAARRPGRTPTAARSRRWPPARLRRRGIQAAQRRRTMHQPPQAVAWSGHANRQARPRPPGRTAPRCDFHVDTALTESQSLGQRPTSKASPADTAR